MGVLAIRRDISYHIGGNIRCTNVKKLISLLNSQRLTIILTALVACPEA